VPKTGSYSIETSMAAFAPATKETAVDDESGPVRLDFNLTLASRSQQQTAPSTPSRAAIGFRGRGAQRLQLQQAAREGASLETESQEPTAESGQAGQALQSAADSPSESVSVLGNTATTTFGNNFNFDREQIQRFIDSQFGVPALPAQGAGPDGA